MPWNTGGAVQGASAGATFGPWGAVIGGLAGGFLSGSGSNTSTPQLGPMPYMSNIGSVSTPYGLAYRDPISGQMVYTSTANLAQIPNNLSNQMMSAAVMGRPSDMSSFTNQLAQLQAQLAQAKSGMSAVPDAATATSGPVNWASDIWQSPLGRGSLWTYGNSGKGSADIDSLRKIIGDVKEGEKPAYTYDQLSKINDWMNQNTGDYTYNMRDTLLRDIGLKMNPSQLSKWLDDYKSSNQNAKDAKLTADQIQAAIDNVKNVQSAYASDPEWSKKNPILNWLNSGDTERYMNEQNALQIQNQQKAAEDAMARKGLGRSTMADMMRAQLGYQQPQAMAAVHQQVGNQNYANRMNMLNYLSGQSQLSLNEELAKMGVSNQQMAMGQNMGLTYAQTDLNRLLSQYGLQNQNQMAQYNQNNLNSQLQQQQLWGGLSSFGYQAGQQGWFRPSGSTSTGGTSGTGNSSWLGNSNYGAGLGSLYGGNYGGGWQNWAGR